MATAASTKKQLDDVVECSICTEVYSDPRSLPCIHSYCFKCIADWCKDKQPGDKVACPLCRQDFIIPGGGVGDLPKNFFIGKLLKISELSGGETVAKVCDLCSAEEEEVEKVDRTADVFCLECQQNLCKSCKKVHSKMKATIAHTVVTIGEYASVDEINVKLSSTFCDKHQNKPIEIYCLDCKTTMCMMCYIKDHNPHKCSDVTEVAGEFRASLTQDIERMTAAIYRFDTKLEALQSTRIVFAERVMKVESEICDRANRLKAMIDDEEQKLLTDLYEIKVNHEKQMDNLAEEITQGKSLVESLNKYCTELVKKGTASDVIFEANNLHRRTEELGNSEIFEDALKNCSDLDVSIRPQCILLDGTTRFLGEVIEKGL